MRDHVYNIIIQVPLLPLLQPTPIQQQDQAHANIVRSDNQARTKYYEEEKCITQWEKGLKKWETDLHKQTRELSEINKELAGVLILIGRLQYEINQERHAKRLQEALIRKLQRETPFNSHSMPNHAQSIHNNIPNNNNSLIWVSPPYTT